VRLARVEVEDRTHAAADPLHPALGAAEELRHRALERQ
jgi:hypothetical protein